MGTSLIGPVLQSMIDGANTNSYDNLDASSINALLGSIASPQNQAQQAAIGHLQDVNNQFYTNQGSPTIPYQPYGGTVLGTRPPLPPGPIPPPVGGTPPTGMQGPSIAAPIYPAFPMPGLGDPYTRDAFNLAGIPPQMTQSASNGGGVLGSLAGMAGPIGNLPIPPNPAGPPEFIKGVPPKLYGPTAPPPPVMPPIPQRPGFVPGPNDPVASAATPVAGNILRQILGGGSARIRGSGMMSRV